MTFQVFESETKVSPLLPGVLDGAWAELKTEKSFSVLSGNFYGNELVLFSVETSWLRARLCSHWCSTSLWSLQNGYVWFPEDNLKKATFIGNEKIITTITDSGPALPDAWPLYLSCWCVYPNMISQSVSGSGLGPIKAGAGGGKQGQSSAWSSHHLGVLAWLSGCFVWVFVCCQSSYNPAVTSLSHLLIETVTWLTLWASITWDRLWKGDGVLSYWWRKSTVGQRV